MADQWTPLAVGFFTHPKVVQVDGPAKLLYLAGLCYSQRHLTDGWLPAGVVPILAAEAGCTRRGAAELERVGLWDAADGGWQIHDWAEWNRPAEQVRRRRADDRARKAALRNGGGTSAGHSAGHSAGPSAGKSADVHASPTPTPTETLTSPTTSTGAVENPEGEEVICAALDLLAERRRREANGHIANLNAWTATVRRNLATDPAVDARARDLLERYTLTAGQLADALDGRDTILHTAPRRGP